MSLVNIENLSHQNGGKILYQNANLRVNKGEHVGLVGPNGAGKTTLLNLIANKATPDHGTIELHPKAKIGYLDQHQDLDGSQTVEAYLKDTFKSLYDIEAKINHVYEQMVLDYQESELTKALAWQEELGLKGFYEIDKKIGNLLNGLGIDLANLNKRLDELSGGQRGKIILTKLLLKNDDFILLDEPTNFLDVTQVEWLAKFLQSYENAYLLVSHDVDFINKTVDIIYAVENKELNRYVGNYDKYLELSALKANQYESARQSQQEKIAKLKDYVARNAARASTARSAQSRQKQLDKMDVLEVHAKLVKPKMNFKYRRPGTAIIVDAKKLEIGYQIPLINPLTFQLREGQKWIVKGHNGIGKTTFLNTLAGTLKPISGDLKMGQGVEIAYFHQVENFEDETPISYLMHLHPEMLEGEVRATIGRFGVKSELMMNPLKSLSGGEQTKVKLAALSLEPNSLLILDEPTNHIDVLAKEALLEAIQAFPGTVLITTHDSNFETQWADKVLNFEDFLD